MPALRLGATLTRFGVRSFIFDIANPAAGWEGLNTETGRGQPLTRDKYSDKRLK